MRTMTFNSTRTSTRTNLCDARMSSSELLRQALADPLHRGGTTSVVIP